MIANPAGALVPCRQDVASSSEELLATIFLAKNPLSPIDAGVWEREPIEIELPEIGSYLGRYQLEAIRGMGSGSVVYRARHKSLDFPVALKILSRRSFSERLALFEQLRLEASILARIQHRNIVRFWDFDDDFDAAFLVTEYVEGPSLTSVLRDCRRLDPARAVRVTLQIVDALEALAQFNIVHRDLKPDNILLTGTGQVKVIDLGLARIMGEQLPNFQILYPPSTWVGTPTYLAPEQVRDASRVDIRADMYSLGITLYQMITGQTPFSAEKATLMVMQHLQVKPTPPKQLNPDLCPRVNELLLRLLEKEPSNRFASYADLKLELNRSLVEIQERMQSRLI